MLEGYSLSFNDTNSVQKEHLEQLKEFLMLRSVDYIISVEHTDRIAEHKDHIQCYFTMENMQKTPACRVLDLMKQKVAFPSFRLPALCFKKHKPFNPKHGFGYCLKEVPDTAYLYATSYPELELDAIREYYKESSKQDNAMVSRTALFYDYIENYDFKYLDSSEYNRTFQGVYDDYIMTCERQNLPKYGEYNECRVNFRGQYLKAFHKAKNAKKAEI